MTIKKIKIIADDPNYLPTKGTSGACGYDLTATDVEIDRTHRLAIYKTGIKIQLPKGYAGLILPRSSIRKEGPWMLANSVGLVDVDFQGEIQVTFRCVSDEWDINDVPYKLGERIGQLMITPFVDVDWESVEKFTKKTKRGASGHGSTGK